MTAEDRQRALFAELQRLCFERDRDKKSHRRDILVERVLRVMIVVVMAALLLAAAATAHSDPQALWWIVPVYAVLLAVNHRNYRKTVVDVERLQASHDTFQAALGNAIEQIEDLLSVYDPGGTEQ